MLRGQTSSTKYSPTWAKTSTGEVKEPIENVKRTGTYYGKDGTEWRSIPMTPNVQSAGENVTLPRNRVPNTQNATSTAETFDLFVSQDTIKLFVKYTNEEGKRQRGDSWKETDNVEIRGLIGILIFLGAQTQS
ncbi:PiggyBac transposable element-derived protein 4 [Plakobranchus ocellatus]|uniref:PiggyBac transposable element-derived protein 4 n=1 Tax=Plakobranchus ocellatus TaxID=259542 RepID=A0AAV4C0M0_9GAST|nr:PiggyBac transposable element-derived protein 4 [Plakobranchus ocellatus]